MKTTITLLIAALTSALCYAQGITPTPLTPIQSLVQRITDSSTPDAVKALEVEAAGILATASATDSGAIVNALYKAYSRAYPVAALSPWQANVFAIYTPNFATSTSGAVVSYYARWIAFPALFNCQQALKGAKNAEEFDGILRAFFSTNLYPERLRAQADSRADAFMPVVTEAASRAAQIAHPEAVNYALLNYKNVNMQNSKGLDYAIGLTARAIKNKDISLTRANAWIASQNTGLPKVEFSEQEKQMPSALQPLATAPLVKTSPSMADAKAAFRAATATAAIDTAIYKVATALKAIDLNLSRANAWIAAQKDGTAFELP